MYSSKDMATLQCAFISMPVKSQKAAVKEDDDFLFGSYSPSAAVAPAGSRPSSMRAVR